MISLANWKISTTFQKLTKNVGDLGKIIVRQALKSCTKCTKPPDLVTLSDTHKIDVPI